PAKHLTAPVITIGRGFQRLPLLTTAHLSGKKPKSSHLILTPLEGSKGGFPRASTSAESRKKSRLYSYLRLVFRQIMFP
ncbi:hypothetical protein NAU80_21970, partial [Pseudomonas stutzeri]|uniref:hypothetical protein n=1 Tax=Stutzerimonas stutzeri TaxID=316 RepID=UPI00210C69A6